MKKILSILGTRPEAVKMAPLVLALEREPGIESVLCITAQHRNLLDPLIELFGLRPDHDLNIMRPDQGLNQLVSRLTDKIDAVLDEVRPDCVLVHGDTTTALSCALAAFHRRVPVGHVEAGLRTGNLSQPFPEEMNRCVIDKLAGWLFAPTKTSLDNLLAENLQGRAWVTGNTVIDALALISSRLDEDAALDAALAGRYPWLDADRRLLLVTGHRRENFGRGVEDICTALRQLAARNDLQVVYPVHPNPNIRGPVQAALGGLPQVRLIDPLDYLDFVWFMRRAHVILTDSGGVQEEAPYLGKPVLVMRDVTERPEAIAAGTARLVGTDPWRIVHNVAQLLDDEAQYRTLVRRTNPYGDGKASQRIVDALCGREFQQFEA